MVSFFSFKSYFQFELCAEKSLFLKPGLFILGVCMHSCVCVGVEVLWGGMS